MTCSGTDARAPQSHRGRRGPRLSPWSSPGCSIILRRLGVPHPLPRTDHAAVRGRRGADTNEAGVHAARDAELDGSRSDEPAHAAENLTSLVPSSSDEDEVGIAAARPERWIWAACFPRRLHTSPATHFRSDDPDSALYADLSQRVSEHPSDNGSRPNGGACGRRKQTGLFSSTPPACLSSRRWDGWAFHRCSRPHLRHRGGPGRAAAPPTAVMRLTRATTAAPRSSAFRMPRSSSEAFP